MPELPEVETARAAIERAGLNRRITAVDDSDTWVCRPHAAGDIQAALLGRRLTGAFRRGKSMWCETSGVEPSTEPGPVLGLHLGMSGHILITDPGGGTTEGGDWLNGRYGRFAEQHADASRWDRFSLTFADGGRLRLFDPRRLGRVRLDPALDLVGPDAALVKPAEFRTRVGRGHAPVKARLLDQSVIAGVGNLLADETLWQARISPLRPSDQLTGPELVRLHQSLRKATRAAIAGGGVHTGKVIAFRAAGRHCPRCGAEMTTAKVGGRSTWWCAAEQT